jgi:hypothetical protein
MEESGAGNMVGKLGFQRKYGYFNGKMNISTEIFIYQREIRYIDENEPDID